MARVVLVTGAARGIGRVIAEDLSADHDVAFTYRISDPARLQEAAPDAFPIRHDMSDATGMHTLLQQVIDRFGRLDAIVNNAGAVEETPFGSANHTAHRKLFDTNLIGPMALLDAALPHLGPGAAIVNISSVNARFPPMGAAAYGASKAALDNWTVAAAKALGPRGIRVNGVAPGAIERDESPRSEELIAAFVKDTALGRVGRPDDIAGVVRFLLSDAAGFITGETITVSGGYRL